MSTFATHTHIGSDRRLDIVVPVGLANSDVEVLVKKRSANGARSISAEERNAILDHLAEGVDDPTFVRPPQGEFEPRESLD